MDEDTLIAIQEEDKAYRTWERETKNRILAMSNHMKKQELWRKLFGVVQEPDDSYLEGAVF